MWSANFRRALKFEWDNEVTAVGFDDGEENVSGSEI